MDIESSLIRVLRIHRFSILYASNDTLSSLCRILRKITKKRPNVSISDGISNQRLISVIQLTEFTLNHARFKVNKPADVTRITAKHMLDIKQCVQLMKIRLNAISEGASSLEESFQRIEMSLQDLISYIENCKEATETGGVPRAPFFTSPPEAYSSEVERNILDIVRVWSFNASMTNPNTTLEQLERTLLSIQRECSNHISEHSWDIVMNSIERSLLEVCKLSKTQSLTVKSLRTLRSISSLVEDAVIAKEDIGFLKLERPQLFESRTSRMRCITKYLKEIEKASIVPLFEENPDEKYPTDLWKKVKQYDSLETLCTTMPEMQVGGKCGICLGNEISHSNFAILDRCVHSFCNICIRTWFTNKDHCPYCRTVIGSWTDRDCVVTLFKKGAASTDGDQSKRGKQRAGETPRLTSNGEKRSRQEEPCQEETSGMASGGVKKSRREEQAAQRAARAAKRARRM